MSGLAIFQSSSHSSLLHSSIQLLQHSETLQTMTESWDKIFLKDAKTTSRVIQIKVGYVIWTISECCCKLCIWIVDLILFGRHKPKWFIFNKLQYTPLYSKLIIGKTKEWKLSEDTMRRTRDDGYLFNHEFHNITWNSLLTMKLHFRTTILLYQSKKFLVNKQCVNTLSQCTVFISVIRNYIKS